MVSSAINRINSALMIIGSSPRQSGLLKAKIGLMNLKSVLLGLRLLGVDVYDDQLDRLSSRIYDATGRINLEEVLGVGDVADSWHDVSIESEVNSVVKEVDEELLKQSSRSRGPTLLGVDEMVGIVDSILDNALDLLVLLPLTQGEAMDAWEVEVTFLKHFLRFAVQTGVGHYQLQSVLLHIQPVVIDAARVFIHATPVFSRTKQIRTSTVQSAAMPINPQVYQAYAQALRTSTFSSTQSRDMNADILENFLDSLISLLWDVLRVRLPDSRKAKVKVLFERLRSSRCILKQRPINFDENIKDQIGGWICDAAIMLICSLLKKDAGNMSNVGLSDLLLRFVVIQANANANTSQTFKLDFPKPRHSGMDDSTITNLYLGNEEVLKLPQGDASSSHPPLRNTPQVVGFQNDEVNSVLDRLTRGSDHLRIVPIIGMAGLGKTTFALELYNHPTVMYHFHVRAWCPISQVFDKKRVFLQLLNQIKPVSDTTSTMTGDDLANEFRKSLKRRRYLIFLDDVWTPEVWNSLTEAFPDDLTGSRVILTSRHRDISPYGLITDGGPYLLRQREVKECLEILRAKLFPEKGWPLELNELRMKIAEKCKGLPLTAVIVAGLLATTEQKNWNRILDSLSSGSLSVEEQCNSALELSFTQLPDELQPCFLYFGAFPEDEEVTVKRLIHLWMAEGFVQEKKFKRREDVAREYMEKLIDRSLVTVVKSRSIGGVKSCRIHDLLHEFCAKKAKQGKLFHVLLQSLDQLSDFNEPHDLQRLSIHSHPLHFLKSRLFCPCAHSLLFFSIGNSAGEGYRLFQMSYIIQIYKLLQVLEMGQIVLQSKIPKEIGFLTQLTYLSFQSNVGFIPSSIGNLSNLETFIAVIRSSRPILFPYTLWNLKNLRYLHIRSEDGFILANRSLENSYKLLELETLSGIVFYSDGSMARYMRMFPNIRRLSCRILPDSNKIFVVPDFLSQLESLRCEFGSAEHLRKVKLNGFELSREDVAVIGVLKLERISYLGGVLQMEGEFAKLRYLKLHQKRYSSYLKRWIASDEQLPNLQKLVLDSIHLTEMPSCLDTNPTLEEIEVLRCSSTVERLVRGIAEEQKEYGNFIKTRITQLKEVST